MTTFIKEVERNFIFEGTAVTVRGEQRFEKETDKQVYDEMLDQALLTKAMIAYQNQVGVSGDFIKALRKQLKKTQQAFAQSLGIHRKTLISYERNHILPSQQIVKRIKSFLE